MGRPPVKSSWRLFTPPPTEFGYRVTCTLCTGVAYVIISTSVALPKFRAAFL